MPFQLLQDDTALSCTLSQACKHSFVQHPVWYQHLVALSVAGDPVTAERDAQSMTVPPSLLDPLAEQNAVMSGLEKFTDYNITVLSFTDPGDGIRSQPVEVRTDEDGKFCFIQGVPYTVQPRQESCPAAQI